MEPSQRRCQLLTTYVVNLVLLTSSLSLCTRCEAHLPSFSLSNINQTTSSNAVTSSTFTDVSDFIIYPVNAVDYRIIHMLENSSMTVFITDISQNYTDFLVVQVHSQMFTLTLRNNKLHEYVDCTNPALVIQMANYTASNPTVVIENHHNEKISVLVLIQNYTYKEPIPGGLYARNSTEPFPRPFLSLRQNLITTWVSFPLAVVASSASGLVANYSGPSCSSDGEASPLVPALNINYEVYLSYLYEGELGEKQFWHAIVSTSRVQGLKKYSVKVAELSSRTTEAPHLLFVSYSGVGAVVNVVASLNGSEGALYSSAIFYGCNFIPGEEYRCTKLASALDQFICACLPFIGLLMLFTGHRWLNFTMFTSGFLASWFFLFILFVQVPHIRMTALGLCTLFGAIACGIGWLIIWHKFHRPFYSALLVILLSAFFAAMISTHFLKYALVPTRHNIAAFIVFPIFFSLVIIGYSILDIKKVHILSCALLGSYLTVVPFAFYFGSSLTYIVINVVSVMAIHNFSQAVGYPPFQYCDIILLCVWIFLFLIGSGYQFYRERSSPPFYPPSAASLIVFIHIYESIKEKVTLTFQGGTQTFISNRCCTFCQCSCLPCSNISMTASHTESYQRLPETGDASWQHYRAHSWHAYWRRALQLFQRSAVVEVPLPQQSDED